MIELTFEERNLVCIYSGGGTRLGTIAALDSQAGWETVIVTGDKDSLQLVTEQTRRLSRRVEVLSRRSIRDKLLCYFRLCRRCACNLRPLVGATQLMPCANPIAYMPLPGHCCSTYCCCWCSSSPFSPILKGGEGMASSTCT